MLSDLPPAPSSLPAGPMSDGPAGMGAAAGGGQAEARRAPGKTNAISMNLLHEGIPKVVDGTAEQVREDFERFLNGWGDFENVAAWDATLAHTIQTQYYRWAPSLLVFGVAGSNCLEVRGTWVAFRG